MGGSDGLAAIKNVAAVDALNAGSGSRLFARSRNFPNFLIIVLEFLGYVINISFSALCTRIYGISVKVAGRIFCFDEFTLGVHVLCYYCKRQCRERDYGERTRDHSKRHYERKHFHG